MSVPVVGDWVSPSWSGHPFFGQTGQILEIGEGGSFRIDVDGDGIADYFLNANETSNIPGSYMHQGMLADHIDVLAEDASDAWSVVVPLVLAYFAISLFGWFLKKAKVDEGGF